MDSERLFDLLGRIGAAADEIRPSLHRPNDVVDLWRVTSVANAVSHMDATDVRVLAPDQIALTAVDASALLDVLQPARPRGSTAVVNVALAARLADRIMQGIGYIVLTSPEAALPAAGGSGELPAPVAETHRKTLSQLAKIYGRDADLERRAMSRLYGASFVFLLGATAVAVVGIEAARHTDGPFRFDVFAAYGVVAVLVLVWAALAMREAVRHRLAASDASALTRQLHGLDAYLAPMPRMLRHLLRGTFFQRVFPSPVKDTEPWREPKWPDTASLLHAIQASDETVQQPEDV